MAEAPAAGEGWRLLAPADYEACLSSGLFVGSPLDARDGFIHLSPPEAVRDTARLYFSPADGFAELVLLRVDLARACAPLACGAVASPTLRWDYVAKRGVSFPHLVGGPLALAACVSVHRLTLDAAGAWSGFPPDLPQQ
jgi:uncharacterized protein (DUF952 family)